MSAGTVGARLPCLRQGSPSAPTEEEGRGKERALRDKDINSICNSDAAAEGDDSNDNSSSGGGGVKERKGSGGGKGSKGSYKFPRSKAKETSEGGNGAGAKMIELPVYLGGSNIILPAPVSQKPSNNRVNNENELQYNRRCCFFWTCCCRCSCLNIKHHSQEHMQKGNKIDHLNGENETIPTIEEVRSWAESFDRLMKCPLGRKAFREFLKCEYSEENILFWQACEDLKRERNPSLVEEKARLIYEDYISILSPKEVSLDSRVRELVNRNMVDPTTRTFDEAQTQIYTLMHRDSYPRFINSPHYKRLAQLNNNGGSSSSTSGQKRDSTS